ncbi:catalase [Comamonas piscis]|uniref:Catalase n=1 Tax=Comamonas piscis TaxID=1562974 RepID=A0A7G5ELA6_9BURK|nr:catalase [Comamonas piscis]QMV74781.1 catalase [Comamonas piscis]WSO33251.1 catalase [Comamonas piscis]
MTTRKSTSSTAQTQGAGGELHEQAGDGHPVMTTQQGIPVSDNQNSLRAFNRGPTLLEDFVLREKITHFDHERIPERIVHARGTAAHGYFELSQSLKKYTTAKVLTEVGKKVPIFARISTVAGGAGSVDTPRDVRGFAIKLYTEEGNWDLVGNNIPVFFIQDAMKFPDLVHAVKMEPDRGFPQAASAHDTFWDFISLMPESMHMIMWAMSDRAIPRSLRTIEGFGVHSFRLVNDKGESTFVKFHWRPQLGIQSTVWDEAAKLQAADNDFHRRDLFEAIEAGHAPAWDLFVQLFTQEEADALPYDHLDPTKIIPEEVVPLTKIGSFTLDRWPDNFFAETEQVAFCPANVPPGIDFSNDPLLQGRLFSYLDTQLSRLGGPNFTQIPVNAPKCPFAHTQRDGHMQTQVPKGRVAYEPSSLDPNSPRESQAQGFRSFAQPSEAHAKSRIRPESFADHYSQARLFYTSQSELEQAHMASALVFELSKVQTPHVREAMVAHLLVIDSDLGKRVAKGLGLAALPKPAKPAVPVQDLPPSPALRIIDRMKPTLEGRCVAILVDDGSNAENVAALQKAILAEKAMVKIIAPKIGGATLSDGKHIAADAQLAGAPSAQFDAVASVIPMASGEMLSKDSAAQDWFRDAFGHLKAIAACKATHLILDAAGVKPDEGVFDPKDVPGFIKGAKSRFWEREPKLRTLA